VITRVLNHIMWWLLWRHLQKIACLHACKFKEAGSNFHYVHVHVLHRTQWVRNPRMWSGLGHDDETDPDHPKHNTVSGPTGCDFMTPAQVPRPVGGLGMGWPPDPKKGIAPMDLEAASFFDIYLALPDAEGRCPEGFSRIRCDCGEFCMTTDRGAWDKWYEDTHPH
jgi:hypothetical protein